MAVTGREAVRDGRFSVLGEEPRHLRLGYEAILDGRAVVHRLARELPPDAADLLEIAALAYAVDRLVRRPGSRAEAGGSDWGRRLWLEAPVRRPSLWNANRERLTELLGWLTGDYWVLEFRQLVDDGGALDDPQGFLFDTVPIGPAPALFSGGLDSAAGLAADLSGSDAIAVSVHTNSWMQATQREVLRGLAASGDHAAVHLGYRVCLHARSVENSQRTRGFLFLAAGIATAWGLGQDRLRVFENGIGAINLPYLRCQYGTQAARAMHPRTLALAESLAVSASGRPFLIEAPFIFSTKAEAIRSAPEGALPVLARTVSCDTGFSARVSRRVQCGRCSSCLLRRQALQAAGREAVDEATAYRTRSPARSDHLTAMLWQLGRLRQSLGRPDPWRGLVLEFPEVLDVPPAHKTEIVRLYRIYVREWDDLGDIFGLGHRGRTAA